MPETSGIDGEGIPCGQRRWPATAQLRGRNPETARARRAAAPAARSSPPESAARVLSPQPVALFGLHTHTHSLSLSLALSLSLSISLSPDATKRPRPHLGLEGQDAAAVLAEDRREPGAERPDVEPLNPI